MSLHSLHHSWDGLVQNVIFAHFSGVTFFAQNFLMPSTNSCLLLVAWLHFRLQIELELVPRVLNRVEVRTTRRRFPPVDAVLLKGGLCSVRGMLWIIILQKTMIGQLLSNEWDRSGFKDVTEENSIHDAIKDVNLCGTMSANPNPNMNFDWMFRFWLVLHRPFDLPVGGTAALLKGNGAFVREDHIVESVDTRRAYSSRFVLFGARMS